jgi:abortive infection bacteriophage resistance protein
MSQVPSGQPPAKPGYTKPCLSYARQVQLLQQRGLLVSDPTAAEQFLSHLNYYRFSGYCLAFEASRHQFIAGTTFGKVVETYQFDLTLRDLVTEALEVVEVDLRASIAYHFGQKYGAFGHTNSANFYTNYFRHADWLLRLQEEAQRSSEQFVTHFKNHYNQFPDLPIWIVMEVMSFGGLSQMVKGMLKPDQKAIAARFGLQPRVLRKATHHFTYVRNLCAHHSRLWDRVWAIKPELPAGTNWSRPLLPGNNKLFCTLLLLRQIMKRIPAVAAFAAEWKKRVEVHIANPPATVDPLNRMGLTANWNQHAVWQ